jgi:hypothetical protein
VHAMVEMFHGLTAFASKTADAVNLAYSARGCLGVEVCVADRPIGRVGLVLHGTLTALHAQDVWSRVRNGRRVVVDHWEADEEGVPFIGRYDTRVASPEWDHMDASALPQGWVNWWCKDVAPLHRTRGDYAEGWLIADHISAVWCRADANDGEYWLAKGLGKKLGVAFVEIKKGTRIWDWTEAQA